MITNDCSVYCLNKSIYYWTINENSESHSIKYDDDFLLKTSKYIEFLLSYYDGRHFLTDDGYDETTNVITITEMTYRKYNVRPDRDYLSVENAFTMYHREVF